MPEFNINQETCSSCSICVDICPAFCLEKNQSGQVNFKEDFKEICLGCGQCMAVCNTKSIVAKGLSYENDFFEFSDSDDFISIVKKRRSVRRFKPKPITDEEIQKILHVVSQAPHGDSHQHVEITVINSREKIMEGLPLMSAFFDKLEKWLKNPFMRWMIKRKKGQHTLNTLMNHLNPRLERHIYRDYSYEYDGITRGAHTLLIFHAPKHSEDHFEDSYIFVTYAMLAAQSLGLGSTIIGLVPAALNKTPKLRKLYNIPDDHDSVTSLIVGYPKYKYRRGIKRNLKKVDFLEN
jgi:nitroreductase/NAD-dependent dihydropyrimidine dehydrogenase PreA subunit